MKKILLTVLLSLGIVGSSFSQNFWEQVNFQINDYSFGMTADGNVYALSYPSFLDKSTSNGALGSWNQVTGFPTDNSAGYSIFTKGNTIFMMNGFGTDPNERGIYASTDGGSTWNTRNNGLGSNTKVFQMHQLADGVLLVTVEINSSTYKTYLSSDDGMNWTAGQSFDEGISTLAVVSANEAYIAVENTIYMSTDNGQTWVNQNSTSPFPAVPYRIVANSNGDLLGIGNDDILESTDQGVTWTVKTVTGLPTLSSGGSQPILLQKLHDETIYLAVNGIGPADDNGIYYSEDWGNTWTDITSNISSTQIFNDGLDVNTDGYLFASPSGSGIFKSAERVTPSTLNIKESNDELTELTVYPNPTEDEVFIESELKGSGSLEIMNQFGQVVYSENFESLDDFNGGIDISKFSVGIYFVGVNTSKGRHVQKLIKK